MLTRLYYLYEKSPKKCRELESVITDLKQCFEFDDDGVRPVRASGSRWISHKLNAMKQVVSKYGAYTTHLSALSCDSSVNPSDRARLTGYLRNWVDAKYLLGCGFFVDLLSPCAIFSKTMQSDNLDILGALTSLLRAVKETNKLCSKALSQWPTYSSCYSEQSRRGCRGTRVSESRIEEVLGGKELLRNQLFGVLLKGDIMYKIKTSMVKYGSHS